MKQLAVILFVGGTLIGCSSENGEMKEQQAEGPDDKTMVEGHELLKNNCYSCHSPQGSHENRAAPPMIAVKRHYVDEIVSEEQFTKEFVAFVSNPTEEHSKMPGARRRFGLMPKMNYDKADLAKIAHYVYHADLEVPDWFEKHYQEEHGKDNSSDLTPMEKGKRIAMQTKGTLGKNLLNAINSNGTEYALTFCNSRAIPLTDSMSLVLNASVKRVSDKNRNPNNKANTQELAYIRKAKEALSNGKSVDPKLITGENSYTGYYPILTNQMCLQCHGNPGTDLTTEVSDKIKALYPADLATGYGLNELRGIWVVEMEK